MFNQVVVNKGRNGQVTSVAYDGVKEGFDAAKLNEAIKGLAVAFSNGYCTVYNPTGSMTRVAEAPVTTPKWEKAATRGDGRAVWFNGSHLATKHRARSGRYYYQVI